MKTLPINSHLEELFFKFMETGDYTATAKFYKETYNPPETIKSLTTRLKRIGKSKDWDLHLEKKKELVYETNLKKIVESSEIKISEADDVVRKILMNEEENSKTRLDACNLIYKRLGGYSPEIREIINKSVDELADEAEEHLNKFKVNIS